MMQICDIILQRKAPFSSKIYFGKNKMILFIYLIYVQYVQFTSFGQKLLNWYKLQMLSDILWHHVWKKSQEFPLEMPPLACQLNIG